MILGVEAANDSHPLFFFSGSESFQEISMGEESLEASLSEKNHSKNIIADQYLGVNASKGRYHTSDEKCRP